MMKKPTGEKQVFEYVHERQKGRCFITDKPMRLCYVTPWNFMHVLPKGQNKYHQLKLNELNIIMVIEQFHTDCDYGVDEYLKKYPKERVLAYKQLQNYLLNIYNLLYGYL